MSGSLHASLAWLPPAPTDFGAQCKALDPAAADWPRQIRFLATHRLDENQLNQLARAIARGSKAGIAVGQPFKLGLISNATTHFMVPVLTATAARFGIALECIEAEYDQVMQEALSPASTVNRAKPDAVLLALDWRGVPLLPSPGDAETARATVAAVLDRVQTLRASIRTHSGALCIVQTLAPPPEPLFGSLDAAVPGTLRQLAHAANLGIAEGLHGSSDLLLDVAALAETVGLADWHDPMLWNLAKLPFSPNFLPLYADHVCRLIAAQRGKSRRCLILDLDNTLWGGVIGDDGLEGIALAQGDATGEAHLAVQRAALALRARGVVLAVSSKNNDETARLPFREHPEMLLKESDIAVFQANWNDKATNIRAIAEALNLGLESMAFLDDNPAERALVRRMLPEVAVPELPEDPALYARTLLAAGYFETAALSAEDLSRAAFYQDNARRVALRQQAGDLDSYLASLNMTMTVQPFDAVGRARIAQLINKSNQFNLTTRRYTEADVEHFENDPACLTMQVRLADTFGDNGMISVLICRREHDDWQIDTWLMSCRVLGRKVENAVLAELARLGSAQGIRRLIGTYIPTERNRLVEDHYARLGFTLLERRDDGATIWALPVADVPDAALPMQILRPRETAT